MDLQKAKELFAVRFYRWALNDFYREIEQGLPLMASIKGGTTMRFIEIWDTLSEHERIVLPLALVKSGHTRAVEITGEYLTREERDMRENYGKRSLDECQLEREINMRRVAGRGRIKKVDGRKFTRRVKQELRPVFRDSTKFTYPTYTVYNPTVGPWTVNTRVHTGQPASYDHSVEAADHVYLSERTYFLCWLGIRGQQAWDLVRDDDDAAAAAISIAVLCSHFMAAI